MVTLDRQAGPKKAAPFDTVFKCLEPWGRGPRRPQTLQDFQVSTQAPSNDNTCEPDSALSSFSQHPPCPAPGILQGRIPSSFYKHLFKKIKITTDMYTLLTESSELRSSLFSSPAHSSSSPDSQHILRFLGGEAFVGHRRQDQFPKGNRPSSHLVSPLVLKETNPSCGCRNQEAGAHLLSSSVLFLEGSPTRPGQFKFCTHFCLGLNSTDSAEISQVEICGSERCKLSPSKQRHFGGLFSFYTLRSIHCISWQVIREQNEHRCRKKSSDFHQARH